MDATETGWALRFNLPWRHRNRMSSCTEQQFNALCSTVPHYTVPYFTTLLDYAILYCSILYKSTFHGALSYPFNALCFTILHFLYCTLLFLTSLLWRHRDRELLYCTVLYHTILCTLKGNLLPFLTLQSYTTLLYTLLYYSIDLVYKAMKSPYVLDLLFFFEGEDSGVKLLHSRHSSAHDAS